MLDLPPDRRPAMSKHHGQDSHAWAGGKSPTPERLSKLLAMSTCINCGRSIPGKARLCPDCQKAADR